ncbi:hypothetical protein SS7213T_11440, partial [Staphylococcus simiae CCM 7213 = CCUG 51256]
GREPLFIWFSNKWDDIVDCLYVAIIHTIVETTKKFVIMMLENFFNRKLFIILIIRL